MGRKQTDYGEQHSAACKRQEDGVDAAVGRGIVKYDLRNFEVIAEMMGHHAFSEMTNDNNWRRCVFQLPIFQENIVRRELLAGPPGFKVDA